MKGLIGLLLVMSIHSQVSAQESMTEEEYYLHERQQLAEAVRELDLSERDNLEMMRHVIDEGNEMSAESLRDSGMSDEGWQRIQDDGRMD